MGNNDTPTLCPPKHPAETRSLKRIMHYPLSCTWKRSSTPSNCSANPLTHSTKPAPTDSGVSVTTPERKEKLIANNERTERGCLPLVFLGDPSLLGNNIVLSLSTLSILFEFRCLFSRHYSGPWQCTGTHQLYRPIIVAMATSTWLLLTIQF